MKNRILSSALALVLIFTSIIAVFPFTVAAESADDVKVTLGTVDESLVTKDLLEAYKSDYKFDTAEQMLEYELALGYLDSVKSSKYAIYVNRYIGTVYYQNLITGQVLTSNPYDHNKTSVQKEEGLFSQIEIEYSSLSNSSGTPDKYYSSSWIREGLDIEVESIEDGIRIFYNLGYKVEDLLAPAAVMREDFDEILAEPMFDKLAALMQELFGDIDGTISTTYGTLTSYNVAVPEARRNGCYDNGRVNILTNAVRKYALEKCGGNESNPNYVKVLTLVNNINLFFGSYQMYSVERLKNEDGEFKSEDNEKEFNEWCELIPALGDEDMGAAYVINSPDEITNYSIVSSSVRAIFGTEIKLDQVHEMVENTRYDSPLESSPWFNCAIEYTLEDDGTLGVNVPGSSVDYNDEYYTVASITPIKYFGCGSLYVDGTVSATSELNDGYGFIPDGSGAVIEFSDILKINAKITTQVYGQDACYSYIGNVKPNEQVTMPVYGIVTEQGTGATVKENTELDRTVAGFFAVIESGATMASISLSSNSGSGKVCVYNSYSPYPSDRYDLSQTLSVGGTAYYNMIAKTHYSGDCKTKITMLTDDAVAEKLGITEYYPTTYVGMAACYKNYLKNTGVLGEIATAAEDLPLYIEALGSIDVVKKILTFPVTVSIPLTDFEDIEDMYTDFINASETLKSRAAEERAAAAELSSDYEDQIRSHIKKAEKYEALADQVDSIVNVNFRLTGFANGGMHFTYPAKLKWERSVGGKKGFKALVAAAKEYNNNAAYNFGVYPDFDFLYINNTAAFDGIGLNRSAARLVDNRYASKQSWNSLININGIFESTYSLLVTPDELDRLFSKFDKKYSAFDNPNLSVSTLGSDINSNFDEDNLQNREQSLGYIKALFSKMSNERNYSLMTDVGNIYSVEYVDHIVNATIDSTHHKNSSYTVPFYGLVLHGYVSYAGTPINNSGSPDYDILRAIENGASLYYILCCQNTNSLKEDPELSKYYGIDYNNWFEKILVQYKTLNDAIGSLQSYEITDHKTIYAERIIDSKDTDANFVRLVNELSEKIDVNLRAKLDKALLDMRNDANYGDYIGQQVCIYINVNDIIDFACVQFNLTEEELSEYGFNTLLDSVIASYEAEGYKVETVTEKTGTEPYHIDIDRADILDDGSYKSKYDYVTDSTATDKNYDYTDFTCDNGNVVMVKYTDKASGKEEIFFLNYNMFAVDITIDSSIDKTLDEGETLVLRVMGQKFLKLSDAKVQN